MGSCMWSSGSPRVTIAEPPLCMGERRAWQAMCHTNSGGAGSGRVAQPRNAKGQFERSDEDGSKVPSSNNELDNGRLDL